MALEGRQACDYPKCTTAHRVRRPSGQPPLSGVPPLRSSRSSGPLRLRVSWRLFHLRGRTESDLRAIRGCARGRLLLQLLPLLVERLVEQIDLRGEMKRTAQDAHERDLKTQAISQREIPGNHAAVVVAVGSACARTQA